MLVPDLPLAAELRAQPELGARPLVIVSEVGPRASVLSVSREARRAGVHPGHALSHARAACAALVVRTASPSRERAARDALRDVALSASPRVEAAPSLAGAHRSEAAVWLDAGGIARVFGSEAGLATALNARATALGLPSVATVASSRFLARVAARRLAADAESGAVQVIEPGEEADFLAPLPVDLLDPDDALAATFTRFGIRRLEQLLALPPRSLVTRLGPPAQHLVARLRGTEREPVLPAPRAQRLVEGADLEAALDRLEPLGFVLRGLLSRLLARLAVRHLACGELDLGLGLEGGGCEMRRVGLAAPTLDARVLLRRLVLALEASPPPAAVESVELTCQGRPLRSDQLDLFRPAGPAPDELDALVAELAALCGPERVGAPFVPDSLRPDAFALVPFSPTRHDVTQDRPEGLRLAMRALRPPLPAQVRTRGERPHWLRSAVANGMVVRCAGPWRVEGAWWSPEERFVFDHFDVQTDDGLLVRLRRDRLRSTWHVDAVYD